MSGHSKWSKIKRKKGATDAKRGREFGRVIKEITVAVKQNGVGDPDFNPRLRVAINNAKGVNMPKDNIIRAIKKALDKDSAAINELTYEGYAPGGIAVFVECATDNLNRTVASVRAVFNKCEGNLATTGSVDYLFERKGVFVLSLDQINMEELELELIDGGAEDIEIDEELNEVEITVAFEDFGTMQQKLDDLKIEAKNARLDRIPKTTTSMNVHDAKKVLRLIDMLEENEDVQQVFHNLEITDELVSDLQAE